jgi:hypothetical protein
MLVFLIRKRNWCSLARDRRPESLTQNARCVCNWSQNPLSSSLRRRGSRATRFGACGPWVPAFAGTTDFLNIGKYLSSFSAGLSIGGFAPCRAAAIGGRGLAGTDRRELAGCAHAGRRMSRERRGTCRWRRLRCAAARKQPQNNGKTRDDNPHCALPPFVSVATPSCPIRRADTTVPTLTLPAEFYLITRTHDRRGHERNRAKSRAAALHAL